MTKRIQVEILTIPTPELFEIVEKAVGLPPKSIIKMEYVSTPFGEPSAYAFTSDPIKSAELEAK